MTARGTLGTPKKRATFLAAIAQGMSVDQAAALIGAGRRTVYHWRREDTVFRQAWDEAIDACTDALEAKLQELALAGDVTALIFMLRSRKAAVYNPNLVVRQAMLKLALEKAQAEAKANGTPMLEGQAMDTNGIRTGFIHIFMMPFNWRDGSPHAPGFNPYGDDEGREIVPVEQDGSGLVMALPERAFCIHHSAPYEHLPASLHCDGREIDPKASTDLWRRILAHNRWLAVAYPALAPKTVKGYAQHSDDPVDDVEPDDEDDPPPIIDPPIIDPPDDDPPPFDHLGGFGRP